MDQTLATLQARLVTLSEDIADMTHTAVRIGERDGWECDLFLAISADIARWERTRRGVRATLRKLRKAQAA
jgi:hypothetical protein